MQICVHTQNQVGFPISDFNKILTLALTYNLTYLRSRTPKHGLVQKLIFFSSKIEVSLEYVFVDWKLFSTLQALLPFTS